jgi:hypothetical protein
MATQDEPTLFSQLGAQVEPTLLSEGRYENGAEQRSNGVPVRSQCSPTGRWQGEAARR